MLMTSSFFYFYHNIFKGLSLLRLKYCILPKIWDSQKIGTPSENQKKNIFHDPKIWDILRISKSDRNFLVPKNWNSEYQHEMKPISVCPITSIIVSAICFRRFHFY